jgi:hypothetical protein
MGDVGPHGMLRRSRCLWASGHLAADSVGGEGYVFRDEACHEEVRVIVACSTTEEKGRPELQVKYGARGRLALIARAGNANIQPPFLDPRGRGSKRARN